MDLHKPFRAVRLHGILLIGLGASVIVGLSTSGDWRWPMRAAVGWDVGVAVFLGLTVLKLIRTRSADDIRRRAADLDQAGAAILPIALTAALASVVIVVGEAVTAVQTEAATTAILTLTTVALSWAFIHLIFALHYAHEFYGSRQDGADTGGLLFPGEDAPDYWDFLHFSLIIGVACQTADVQIVSRPLRRLSTLHSALAFLFNTVILALAVNSAVSLMGS
ncbi:DUF1345 domain-containing protein [Brevundimonas variabilis]|uniref:Putative membrane protein n=1 Tax=Brevundimonas variabilis TaxID=74312 RepID=A0A7W9FCR3_9CAUL|nr:DUF1345 domain-containing protein [Brevundimonas variabilis]MBB5744462.1 putative membrane protein [Brevundimonas variabilis]